MLELALAPGGGPDHLLCGPRGAIHLARRPVLRSCYPPFGPPCPLLRARLVARLGPSLAQALPCLGPRTVFGHPDHLGGGWRALGAHRPITADVLGRPPPWPRSSCRAAARAARDCLASLQDGPARPSRLLPARLATPPLAALRRSLPSPPPPLPHQTSQMESIESLSEVKLSLGPISSVAGGRWAAEPSILQLWTDTGSWSEAVVPPGPPGRGRQRGRVPQSPIQGTTHTHTYTHLTTPRRLDHFTQLESPVTGRPGTNYNFPDLAHFNAKIRRREGGGEVLQMVRPFDHFALSTLI